MKTEEYKSIEDLLDRFFEGQTSNEEERVLYKFLRPSGYSRPSGTLSGGIRILREWHCLGF